MFISMIGIDHSKAPLEKRECFSLSKQEVKEALAGLKCRHDISGCILISTCNRTELWVSQREDRENLKAMLCSIRDLSQEEYEPYFILRQGQDAIDHILNLVCGFNSKIFGEDQIITQVKHALILARKAQCVDGTLDRVFQTALSAGKAVKSKVKFSNVNRSSAMDTVSQLRKELGSLQDIRCLVIGNGQMGKLVANLLVLNGADVSMTLRKRIHEGDQQNSIIPEGCKMVAFEDRSRAIGQAQVVVSATMSPHYTVKPEDVQVREGEPRFFFDLAVPRDIDPQVGKIPGVRLWDIDTMNSHTIEEENSERLKQAKDILDDYREDMVRWFKFRKYVDTIEEILDLIEDDTDHRFYSMVPEDYDYNEEVEKLEGAAKEASRRAVAKILYGLKENLPMELWGECMGALHKAAKKETLKH